MDEKKAAEDKAPESKKDDQNEWSKTQAPEAEPGSAVTDQTATTDLLKQAATQAQALAQQSADAANKNGPMK